MCVTRTIPTYVRLAKRRLLLDAECAAHERVDAAEERVGARREVGGGLPGLLVVERRQAPRAEAQLPGIEAAAAVGERVADAGREVARREAGGDRVRDLVAERRRGRAVGVGGGERLPLLGERRCGPLVGWPPVPPVAPLMIRPPPDLRPPAP